MAKRKGNISAPDTETQAYTRLRSTPLPDPVIPTGDPRHISSIRDGKLDTSVCFSKATLAKIPVDPDAAFYVDQEKKLQRAEDAKPKTEKKRPGPPKPPKPLGLNLGN